MRENPPLKLAILAAALVVFFALPSFAWAGMVVPPGNSAATQYTQVFPTAGGNVAVGNSIGEAGGGGEKHPSKVIGKKTTRELESKGPEGAAAAQLAAESAPEVASEPEASGTGESSSGGGRGSGDQAGAKGGGSHRGGAEQGGNANDGGGKGGAGNGPATTTTGTAAAAAAGSGSSGFSEVLGQATGASSGPMGIFLPLVLLAALVLALVYAWRHRQHEHGGTL